MDARECNGTTLAYIGDAVMSLWIRDLLVSQGWQKPKLLQKKSEGWVSARAQEVFLKQLLAEEFFTKEELAIVMRGRNAKTDSVAKNASVQTYRMATGLEAIIGYLYMEKKEARLQALWARIQEVGEVK